MFFHSIIQEVFYYYQLIVHTHSINQMVFLFFLYSILGWLLEIVYRTFQNKRLTNPGFLQGPVVPIYGILGVFILATYVCIKNESIVLRLFVYFSVITIIEYITGELLLKIFKKRYWDYTDDFMNIRGHICLPFSIAWAVLSVVFEKTIYPISIELIAVLPSDVLLIGSILVVVVLQIDFAYSTGLLPGLIRRYGKVTRSFPVSVRIRFPRLRFREGLFGLHDFGINIIRMPKALARKNRPMRIVSFAPGSFPKRIKIVYGKLSAVLWKRRKKP
ncbi:MAG: putative ABC transporter permease [Proteobacteria bacterium]|nr:putative ABC transporter permease [Pseudomonadota bacterium]